MPSFMFRYHFRVLLVYLRWRLRGKPRASSSKLSMQASAFDCDFLGHINNARYLELFDAGRTDLFLRMGLFDAAREGRWHMVVGTIQVRYRREIRRGVHFTMHSMFLRTEGKVMIFSQQLYIGEVLATEAEVQVLIVKDKKVLAPDFLAHLFKGGVAGGTSVPAR